MTERKLPHRLRVAMIDGEIITAAADDKMVAALVAIKMDHFAVLHDDDMKVRAIVNPRHIVSIKIDVASPVDKTAPWGKPHVEEQRRTLNID